MMSLKGSFAAAAFLSCSSFGAEAAAVTPVEKVIELLAKLEQQVTEEGKKEAAEYDKYACFCKEESSDKLYAIEKSKKKIEELVSNIEKLNSEISGLNKAISDLGKEINDLETKMADAQRTRDIEHEAFRKELADVNGAISACKRALAALKESKGDLQGHVDADSLAQIQAYAQAKLGSSPELANLLAMTQPNVGKATQYSYHSNEIIAVIDALEENFEKQKRELQQEEFNTKADFDSRQLANANSKKFKEQEKQQKEALAEEKNEELAARTADKDEETKDEASDQSFLDTLTTECENKAQLWDSRSQTRADELKALSEAQVALKEGVAPNWKANKNLVGLQTSAVGMHKGHWVYVEDSAPKVASFLQIHRLRGSSKGSVSKRISEFLMTSAEKLKSSVLSAAALKVSVSEDHFAKVRQIIKDLVAKLEAEAMDEMTQKSMCDRRMHEAVTSRDDSQGRKEKHKAEIDSLESTIATLNQDVAELSTEIANNKKALMEATELRNSESEENRKTIAEANAGRSAVEDASEVLRKFYQGADFVQIKGPDRAGDTFASKAPETSFDSEYSGNQQASKGILGMLDVILTDFERTIATVTKEEDDAASEFDRFKGENEEDTRVKEGTVDEKEGQITEAQDRVVEETDALHTADQENQQALNELQELKSMCVEGIETYGERVATRKREIEALKEAHNILEDWQN